MVATPDNQASTLLSDYVLATGTANAISIAPAPSISSQGYVVGQTFTFKAISTNTSTVTLAVNGLATKNIFKNGQFSLGAGDIKNGAIVQVEYDGTQFQMISQSSLTKVSQTGSEIYATSTTGNTAYVVGYTPAVTQYTAGLTLRFSPDAGGGHATLNVNSLGAKNIFKNPITPVSVGDIIANQIAEVVYDGTQFQLTSKVNVPISITNGVTTFDMSSADATVLSIPHGLGVTPSRVELTGYGIRSDITTPYSSSGYFDGTNQYSAFTNGAFTGNSSSVAIYGRTSNNGTEQSQAGTVTVNRTNIVITWAKTNSPSGTMNILWKAQVNN